MAVALELVVIVASAWDLACLYLDGIVAIFSA